MYDNKHNTNEIRTQDCVLLEVRNEGIGMFVVTASIGIGWKEMGTVEMYERTYVRIRTYLVFHFKMD